MDFIKGNYEWMATIAALVVAIWAAASAQGSRNEARKSRQVAERAAKLADRATAAAEESARADAQMAAIARAERDAADAALARSPWEITQLGKHRVRLTNTGPKAYEVVVGIDAQYMDIEGEPRESSDVDTGEFLIVSYMLASDNTGAIKLEWSTSAEQGVARIEQRDVLR